MANPSVRRRAGSGTGRQHSVAAAARAAAKRAEKAQRPEEEPEGTSTGRTATAAPPKPDKSNTTSKSSKKNDPNKPVESPKSDESPKPSRTLKMSKALGASRASAEGDAADGADAADAAGTAEKKRFGMRPGMLTAVLAVLVVVGLVAAAVLGQDYLQSQRTDAARKEAMTAASKAAPEILSYDYHHLDKDFAKARSHLTGGFSDKYKNTTQKVVGPTAKKYQGVVKATVAKPRSGGDPAASVVSASPDKVVVLLFINQVTKSTQVNGPRVDMNRVRMTMSRTSGGWKVSAVDAL